MKYSIFDDLGNHFVDRAIELVKSGHKFVYILDNIDWEEKTHDMRQKIQNQSVHAVATTIVFNRIPDRSLPDSGPQKDIHNCNIHELVALSDCEMQTIRHCYRAILAKLLFEHFSAFEMFKPFTPKAPDSCYINEMAIKSEIVTMPILLKDEKKYSDCVDILDQLENWTEEIYSSAGLCLPSAKPNDSTTPMTAVHSRPDQPASHAPPAISKSDPLHGVKIPCFGDQLTRVRMAGSKDLRAGCHSAKQRLDHLYPFCIVDWHTKRSFLKVQCNFCVVF